MQTFVPYDDLTKIAVCLDNKRLGKQRVEVLQILNALAGKSTGWAHHPAAIMWRGHEQALIEYGMSISSHWKSLGFKDTCNEKIYGMRTHFHTTKAARDFPLWWGTVIVHNSHRAKLLQKAPQHYSQFGWDVPADMEYCWPTCACGNHN